MWQLQLTSEESSVDTVRELLEAQSDGDLVEEPPAPRYGVLFDKVTFSLMLDAMIIEL